MSYLVAPFAGAFLGAVYFTIFWRAIRVLTREGVAAGRMIAGGAVRMTILVTLLGSALVAGVEALAVALGAVGFLSARLALGWALGQNGA
ncbi:MAG: hypothetical protein AAFW69_06940 [Pseudomonadota bacterium]